MSPVDVMTDGETLLVDRSVGEGLPVEAGEIATIHYALVEEGGKELADTTLRGLPFAFKVASSTPLVDLLEGMRAGGERTVYMSSNLLRSAETNLLPRDTDLVLNIRLVSVKPFRKT
ncbi:FKBP-type peptidyl-prolyl cis-trans isomerase [Fimbriimonas ginsengisoli Gsoil 348]|uniref:Peptidyl-prolyl cis-trans isomerase n=1 Tax=Fimbriimonas ginsengisoli Gsoil 348 TaxID=661478 RepID=A0A068NZ07_FIMGI|nr:FKBP-type peptidyl-prolyl cis-trans isomerase [Fimbriimonas ginsengisoli Gsoil 348]